MIRTWTLALLVLAPMLIGAAHDGGKTDKDVKIEGKITKDDPKDAKRNTPCKIHLLPLKGGTTYTIEMMSTEFDTYLRLEEKAGKELGEDDDGGGGLNSKIDFNCPIDGEYKIICTTFTDQMAGRYTLLVKSAGTVRTISAHEVLIGKPAPDFEGDFALNGKPIKLSDLKGKIVLVEFWSVASEPCTVTFPRLREWRKTYGAEGLEIVGVTYYTHEIGQKLGFDKTTGKLKRIDESNKDSEQAMLREFAAYHQLEHLLMVLPKENALKTFDVYAVNGVPHFVLLDRAGIVRTIGVGEDARTATLLETEIKKLLAEK